MEIKESGDVALDLGLISPSQQTHSFGVGSEMTLAAGDIGAALAQAFDFSEALYDEIDGNGRYQQFGYNVALVNLGMRQIVSDSAPPHGGPRYRQHDGPIQAYSAPRSLTRNGLRAADDEIRRTVVRIRRRSQQPPETRRG